jgi:hypothetical protein
MQTEKTMLNPSIQTAAPAPDAADAATDRAAILEALERWIRQRPGLDYGNYGDPVAYRAEVRSIGRDLQDARALLRAVERRSITAADLRRAFESAFSGRLSWDGKRLDYTTGQYWPTEYRRAVAAVLASALWAYWRDHCMPAGELMHNSETGETLYRYKGMRASEYIRHTAKLELGAPIARRYFN